MEYLILKISSALPMALLIWVGTKYGVAKSHGSKPPKLPINESIAIFLTLWLLAAILVTAFHFLLSGMSKEDQLVPELLVPLIVGIAAGIYIVEWRQKVNAR